MEEQVCSYFKFGFCKFKSKCRRIHLKETCSEPKDCENSKTCNKRHPRMCKMFAHKNACRFNQDCAYSHSMENKVSCKEKDNHKVQQQIEDIERIIQFMVDKIENLEAEVQNIKKSEEIVTNDKVTIQTKQVEKLKKRETVKSASDKSNIVTPKEPMTEKAEVVSHVKVFKCDECDFTSTKKSIFTKHKSKHNSCVRCDKCGENLDCKEALKLHKDTKHNERKLGTNSSVFNESCDSILRECEDLLNM